MKKINTKSTLLAIVLLALLGTSCKDSATQYAAIVAENTITNKPIRSVLTAEEQADMSPDEIIGRLKKGNENFVANNLTTRDHSEQRRLSIIGQYPQALVLSCVDSRVPVEDVFDLGIGDVFVARVAGNIENKDIVGSMEFASAVAGSKVVIVMGHSACGAVKHAIDGTDAASMGMSSLQSLLDEIKPAMETIKGDNRTSKDATFLHEVISKNVYNTVADIRTQSPTMEGLEKEGKLKIVGAFYDMETGKVSFLK